MKVDLLIIGGGINGVGIARDAVGRGLSVVLCEQGDLAGATSSSSSKLIHGGLRYLEQFHFRLVREALSEREVLLRNAPHIIHAKSFLLPHSEALRPVWMIRTGLFLYDHLGKNTTLPRSYPVDLAHSTFGAGLKENYEKGFVYSDCWVDDARLVVLNAIDAADKGAKILTRTACVKAERLAEYWCVTLENTLTKQQQIIEARCVINAAGPWVQEVQENILKVTSQGRVSLVKGSHIIVPKLYDGDHAWILQNEDDRVIFVIPYEKDYSLIGTTDVPHPQPEAVTISETEVAYLCQAVNRYTQKPIKPSDVVASYAGLRPLYDDGKDNPSTVTRDYVLEVNAARGSPPLLTIYGGKITTYRCLAEHALKKLHRFFPHMGPIWTNHVPLPGGDIGGQDWPSYQKMMKEKYDFLPEALMEALLKRHGSRITFVLEGVKTLADLGQYYGGNLYEREVAYFRQHEWAVTDEDILWRRTKEGLSGAVLQDKKVLASQA